LDKNKNPSGENLKVIYFEPVKLPGKINYLGPKIIILTRIGAKI
jgi:hypothetical protein